MKRIPLLSRKPQWDLPLIDSEVFLLVADYSG
jgi:hypothetical protein